MNKDATSRAAAALTVCMLAAGLLAGCASEHHGDLGNRNIRPNSVRTDAFGNKVRELRFADDQRNEMNRINGRQLNSNNLVGAHQNYRMEMNPSLAESISGMDGVGASFVMMTDRNAYVAVTLEDGKGGDGTDALSGVNRTNLGHAGDRSRDGSAINRYVAGNKDRLLRSLEAGRAAGQAEVPQQLKDAIADEVRRISPLTERVYVSASPDFAERMSNYALDVKDGHPIQGFIAEFNAMVDRVFPAESGIRSRAGRTGMR